MNTSLLIKSIFLVNKGPRIVSAQGGRPTVSNRNMVRILVLKMLHNLSDEQMEYQMLDRMSYQRFCGLENAINIPERTTIWKFEQRIGESGAKPLFDGASTQLLKKGFIARGGQVIDASLVPCTEVEKQPQREQTPEAKSDPV